MLDSSSVSQEKVNDLWFEGDHPYLRDEVASLATVVLQKLPPGPTRSLGGYFDYGLWPDCERFLELDRAIQLRAQETTCKAA